MNTVSTTLTRFSFTACMAAASASLIVLAGCASTGAPADATLARYEQLQPQADGVRSYRSPEASRYRHADVEPGDIRIAESASLSAEQAQEVKTTLNAALAASLQKAGLREGGATPKLRVIAKVTAVERANPALNAITTLILLAPVSRGGMAVEIEAVDAVSGERVAAMAYQGKAGIGDAMSAYSSMGHVALEADRAAQRFATLIVGGEAHVAAAAR